MWGSLREGRQKALRGLEMSIVGVAELVSCHNNGPQGAWKLYRPRTLRLGKIVGGCIGLKGMGGEYHDFMDTTVA